MGVFVLSFLTSSGGGLLRDVLLNTTPAIFTNISVFYIIITIIIVLKTLRSNDLIDKMEGTFIFRITDTIGLVAFAISGAQTAILYEHSFFGVVIVTFLTSVGGGIVRDILVNEVPEILQKGFYGTVAVLIGVTLYLLNKYGVDKDIAVPSVFAFGLILRYIAITKNLKLPYM